MGCPFDIMLEDIRNDNEWQKIIKRYLAKRMDGIESVSLTDHDGYDSMVKGIENKLGQVIKIANYLYFEYEYNESAWKDMISLFYVNNMHKIYNTVMRVHLFLGDKSVYNLALSTDVSQLEKVYLGYFNIRPLYGDLSCVSYIMLNYNLIALSCKMSDDLTVPMAINTYRRKVHIKNAELAINTFPYFGRDDKLVVCAQADLLMMSRYIYRKLHMPELTLKHICQNRSRDRLDIFPTRGITDRQIMDIFYDRDINIRDYSGNYNVKELFKAKGGPYSLESIGALITSMLDSNLPVMIVFDRHVVIANGISEIVYCKEWKLYERYYVIYDDSAALISKLDKHETDIPFLGMYSWNEIVTYIGSLHIENEKKTIISNRHDDLMVIVPFYNKVNMDYFKLVNTIKANSTYFAALFHEQGDSCDIFEGARWKNSRVFLINCNDLKRQMAEIESDSWELVIDISNAPELDPAQKEDLIASVEMQKALYDEIINSGLPHYYWCMEIPTILPDVPQIESDSYLYYIFDSAPSVTTDFEKICINSIRKGDDFWERKLKQLDGFESINNFFNRYAINVHMQPFTMNRRINANHE